MASATHHQSIMFRNQLRQNDVLLYRLLRQFGQTVVLHKPTTNTYNIQTGAVTREYDDFTIRRAAVLPQRTIRDFVYDLSFIANNKNFTYGAYFDRNHRWIIVRQKDITGETPDLGWYLTFGGKRYTVEEIQEAEDIAGWILVCNNVETQ